jgi:hypothetical protein
MTLALPDRGMSPEPCVDQRGPRPSGVPALLLGGVAVGVVTGTAPVPVVVVVVAIAVGLLVAVRPALAAILWMSATPLVVGIDRGNLLPVLRPNEALLVLLCVALAARWSVLAVKQGVPRLAPRSIDAGFLLLLLTGTALPLLWMVARGKGLSSEDVLASAVVAKYFVLFVLFRMAVRTERQALRCLWASMTAAVVVAVLAVLQSLGLFGVPDLLAAHWAPSGLGLASGRGSSTIGNPHGTADVLVFNLAISLALVLRHRRGPGRVALLLLAGVFVIGALGSGQASAVIGLAVGLIAVGHVLRQLPRIVLGALLMAPVALLTVSPVIARRLATVDQTTGLPSSWSARLDNLSTYFWPGLFSGHDWLLGVQVLPQVAGRESWQSTVYIESGHTWFLWIGGVPYLLSFLLFTVLALRTSRAAARLTVGGAFAAAGVASYAAFWTVFVLTLIDPHLFLRGSADLSIPLLALATSGCGRAGSLPDGGTGPGTGSGGTAETETPANDPNVRT